MKTVDQLRIACSHLADKTHALQEILQLDTPSQDRNLETIVRSVLLHANDIVECDDAFFFLIDPTSNQLCRIKRNSEEDECISYSLSSHDNPLIKLVKELSKLPADKALNVEDIFSHPAFRDDAIELFEQLGCSFSSFLAVPSAAGTLDAWKSHTALDNFTNQHGFFLFVNRLRTPPIRYFDTIRFTITSTARSFVKLFPLVARIPVLNTIAIWAHDLVLPSTKDSQSSKAVRERGPLANLLLTEAGRRRREMEEKLRRLLSAESSLEWIRSERASLQKRECGFDMDDVSLLRSLERTYSSLVERGTSEQRLAMQRASSASLFRLLLNDTATAHLAVTDRTKLRAYMQGVARNTAKVADVRYVVIYNYNLVKDELRCLSSPYKSRIGSIVPITDSALGYVVRSRCPLTLKLDENLIPSSIYTTTSPDSLKWIPLTREHLLLSHVLSEPNESNSPDSPTCLHGESTEIAGSWIQSIFRPELDLWACVPPASSVSPHSKTCAIHNTRRGFRSLKVVPDLHSKTLFSPDVSQAKSSAPFPSIVSCHTAVNPVSTESKVPSIDSSPMLSDRRLIFDVFGGSDESSNNMERRLSNPYVHLNELVNNLESTRKGVSSRSYRSSSGASNQQSCTCGAFERRDHSYTQPPRRFAPIPSTFARSSGFPTSTLDQPYYDPQSPNFHPDSVGRSVYPEDFGAKDTAVYSMLLVPLYLNEKDPPLGVLQAVNKLTYSLNSASFAYPKLLERCKAWRNSNARSGAKVDAGEMEFKNQLSDTESECGTSDCNFSDDQSNVAANVEESASVDGLSPPDADVYSCDAQSEGGQQYYSNEVTKSYKVKKSNTLDEKQRGLIDFSYSTFHGAGKHANDTHSLSGNLRSRRLKKEKPLYVEDGDPAQSKQLNVPSSLSSLSQSQDSLPFGYKSAVPQQIPPNISMAPSPKVTSLRLTNPDSFSANGSRSARSASRNSSRNSSRSSSRSSVRSAHNSETQDSKCAHEALLVSVEGHGSKSTELNEYLPKMAAINVAEFDQKDLELLKSLSAHVTVALRRNQTLLDFSLTAASALAHHADYSAEWSLSNLDDIIDKRVSGKFTSGFDELKDPIALDGPTVNLAIGAQFDRRRSSVIMESLSSPVTLSDEPQRAMQKTLRKLSISHTPLLGIANPDDVIGEAVPQIPLDLDLAITGRSPSPESDQEGDHYLPLTQHPSATQITLEALSSDDFNVLDWSHGDLVYATYLMFEDLHFVEEFSLSRHHLEQFIREIAQGYNLMPYHNWYHGVCVGWFAYRTMKSSKVLQHISKIEALALLVASFAHDVGHPGQNNDYLIATESELALLYNDRSVLENLHANVTTTILSNPTTDFLKNTFPISRRQFRKTLLATILATDMSQHFSLCRRLDERAVQALGDFKPTHDMDRALILELVIHSGDLCAPVLPMKSSLEWERRITREFIEQAKLEEQHGLLTAPSMRNLEDPRVRSVNQVSFIDVILTPLWRHFATVFPEMSGYLDQLKVYRKFYVDAAEGKVELPKPF